MMKRILDDCVNAALGIIALACILSLGFLALRRPFHQEFMARVRWEGEVYSAAEGCVFTFSHKDDQWACTASADDSYQIALKEVHRTPEYVELLLDLPKRAVRWRLYGDEALCLYVDKETLVTPGLSQNGWRKLLKGAWKE